ncbi:MAG: hypothetical protein WCD53_11385 [Microcoleus sp.]
MGETKRLLTPGMPPSTAALTGIEFWVLLNTGMNSSFRNGYKPSRVGFVTSSEKLIHTMNQQRRFDKTRRGGDRRPVTG